MAGERERILKVLNLLEEDDSSHSSRQAVPSSLHLHPVGSTLHACAPLVQRGQGRARVIRVVHAKRNVRRKQGRTKGRGEYRPSHKIGFVHSPAMLMPDEVIVDMPYAEAIVLTTNGAGGYTARRQVNALYDPDPAVGGASYTGLSSWKNLYSYYRVLSYSYRVEFANGEAFPMLVSVINTNTDPGTSAYGNAALLNQPYVKSKYLGPTTGDGIGVLKGHVEISKLLGSNAFEADDNFRGLTGSANPSDLIWCSVNVAVSGGNTMTTAGVKGFIMFRAKTRLYDRVELTA